MENAKEHKFTKTEITEIAFHIYVPKGTGLKEEDTRKSTWMNPLVGRDEAMRMGLNEKIMKDTQLAKVFEVVASSKLERDEMERRGITPDLLPVDAQLSGFGRSEEKPVGKMAKSKLYVKNGRPSSARSTGSRPSTPRKKKVK